MNVANALKIVYQELDIPNWQELVTFPQPKPQMPPPPPPIKMNLEDFTPEEQAQIKAKYGIRPDIQGMAMQHQQDMQGGGIEHEHALARAHQAHAHALEQQAMQQDHEKNLALLQAIGGQGVGGSEPMGGG
jgi:hypothetical protein